MVNIGRADRRTARRPDPGLAFDIHIGRVLFDGVPPVGQDQLAAAIQASLVQALAAGPATVSMPPSRNVAYAAGSLVHLDGSPFASQVADAVTPAVLGAPSGRVGRPAGEPT